MDSRIDDRILRYSSVEELAKYYRDTLAQVDSSSILRHLFAAVECESVPARVCTSFLSARALNEDVISALHYEKSTRIQKFAIQEFGRRLRHNAFREVWAAAGNTHGLVDLMASLSIHHLKLLCGILGRGGTPTTLRKERQSEMTELWLCLTAHSSSSVHNPEIRPVKKFYNRILPACDPELVRERIQSVDGSMRIDPRIIKSHSNICRQVVLERIKSGKHLDNNIIKDIQMLISDWSTTPHAMKSKDSTPGTQFGINVLREVGLNADLTFESQSALNDIATQLVRMLWIKSIPTSTRITALQTVRKSFEAHRDRSGPKQLGKEKSIIHYMVLLWARDLAAYTDELTKFLRLHMSQDRRVLAQRIVPLLRLVAEADRWTLLTILVSNLEGLKVDIEDDVSLAEFKEEWPGELFLALPYTTALKLYQRLKSVRPATEFLSRLIYNDWNGSIFDYNYDKSTAVYDIWLSRREAGSLVQARKLIEQAKKDVGNERNADKRARFAELPICCAVASDDLDVYSETLLWLRRFNKDRQTVKVLYSASQGRRTTITTDEAVELVAGVPTVSTAEIDLDQIKTRVRKGNEIMLLVLETARLAMREPGFLASDWASPLKLFSFVVWERIRKTFWLSRTSRFSDDDLWNSIWQDTVETLLKAEQIGLQESNKALGFNRLAGAMGFGSDDTQAILGTPTQAVVFRFFDELAQRRETIWQDLRRSEYPLSVTLSPLWPKGLCFQAYLPPTQKIDLSGGHLHMPYITTRASSIVFMEPTSLLAPPTTDREEQNAISPFIDSYTSALRFYVQSFDEKSKRAQANAQSWTHVVKNLSSRGITGAEVILYWHYYWKEAGLSAPNTSQSHVSQEIRIPDLDDPSQPLDWNPDPSFISPHGLPKELDLTSLDCMLSVGQLYSPNHLTSDYNFKLEHFKTNVEVRVPSRSESQRKGWLKASSLGREAMIIAALLWIQGKSNLQGRILDSPFPSSNNVRFPAMFLDGDILDRKDVDLKTVDLLLATFGEDVPSPLVLRLGLAIENAYSCDDYASASIDLQRVPFRFWRMLLKGDKPHIVLERIRHVIVNKPDDSAWHRYLFTKGLLDSLSAAQAKSFLTLLFDDISRKLQEQTRQKSEGEDGAKPLIKITTIKMLAQLLQSCVFIDEKTTCELLCNLLASTTHIDIRIWVIKSLGDTLCTSDDAVIRELVLQVLERYVVPVAAGLYDRKPLTEADWVTAEQSLELPETPDFGRVLPSLGELLTLMERIPEALWKDFMDRLMVPTIRSSSESTARWMKLFLKRHELPTLDSLPDILHATQILERIIESPLPLPTYIFKMWADYNVSMLAPSEALVNVISEVEASDALKESEEKADFLGLWHDDTYSFVRDYADSIRLLIYKTPSDPTSGRVSLSDVVETIFKHIENLVKSDNTSIDTLKCIFAVLAPPFEPEKDDDWIVDDETGYMFSKKRTGLTHEERWARWRSVIRPFVYRIIIHIDALRTREWQSDAKRSPSILYDTFHLKLWMMAYPLPGPSSGNENAVAIFDKEIVEYTEALAERLDKPYHKHFQQLKEAVMRTEPADRFGLACSIASSDQGEQSLSLLAATLRVELASELLKSAEKPRDESVVSSARALLQRWDENESEEIRLIAAETRITFRKKCECEGSNAGSWVRDMQD